MPEEKNTIRITSGQKLVFAICACVLLSFLFPVASPLFFSLFLGIAIRESGLEKFQYIVSELVLYGSTLMLGLLLGVLCDAHTIMNPKVLPLLLLGILALLLSGVGGLLGGYIMYFITGGKYNPVIGIAGGELRAQHGKGRTEMRVEGQSRRNHSCRTHWERTSAA